MRISRRNVLFGAAATGLASAMADGFGLVARADFGTADFAALRERWVDIVTGRMVIVADDAKVVAAIAKLDASADNVLADLLPGVGTRTSVLGAANLAEENSKYITTTARASLTLATAWATPGSKHFGDEQVAEHARDALADFLRLRYNTAQREYGNWWDWEIGAARAVADVMCILFAKLPADLVAAADAGVRHFVPDPWQQFMAPRPHRVSTGANRVDLCQAVIASSIVTGDAERVRHAVEGLPPTWAYVTEGDGFYRDGSFIQHTHVPYTGSYGGVLLTGLSALFALLTGSELDIPQSARRGIYRAIDESVIPVMMEGQVLAAVRGRSVSRNFESGATHGGAILGAMLMLAKYAPAELGQRWQAVCKGWLERNDFDDFFDTSNIVRLSLMRLALSGPDAAPPLATPTMYPSMDRLIHRTPEWSAVVAMCSNRISWYECGNGENELGSRTGSGMRYLYLPGQLGQYEDAFWPTMDRAAPPGATVDRAPLVAKAGGEWGENTPANEWTGGLTSGEYSVAAMHLVGPDASGLTARRMWFGTSWGLVELVADVRTAAGPATTVLEHRKYAPDFDPELKIDGRAVGGGRHVEGPRWAHLRDVGGYVFLSPAELTARIEDRKGKWADINVQKRPGHDVEHVRRYATMHLSHARHGSGAWMLLPGMSLRETEAVAMDTVQARRVRVIRNDASAQVVGMGGMLAFVVWRSVTYEGWRITQPLVALAEPDGDELVLTIAEPQQKAAVASLVMPGRWRLVDGLASVSEQGDGTRVDLSVVGQEGRAIRLHLRKA